MFNIRNDNLYYLEIMYNSSDHSIHTGNDNLTHYPDNHPLRCYTLIYSFVIFFLLSYLHTAFQMINRKIQKTISLCYTSLWMGSLLASCMETFRNKAGAMATCLLSSMTLTSILWGGCEREPEVDTSLVSADFQSCSVQRLLLFLTVPGDQLSFLEEKQNPTTTTTTAI